MRNGEYMRRKSASIAGQSSEALALLKELVVEGRVSYTSVIEVVDLLHTIRENALQMEAKV